MPTIRSAVRRVASRGALLAALLLLAQNSFATDYYAASTGGNWTTTDMWRVGTPSGPLAGAGVYPGLAAGDTAFIQTTSGVTVTAAIANDVILAHSCACTLDVQTGGTLKVTSSSTVGGTSTVSLSGGTITNNGTLDFAASAAFTSTGGTLNGTGTTHLSRTGTAATMTMSAGTTSVSTGILNIDGQVTQTGTANFSVDSGAQVNITSNGVIELQNTQGIGTNGVGSPAINNNGGLFLKSAGAFGTNILVNLNNTNGTIRTTVNSLVLGGSPTHNGGTFDANGGDIAFAGSPTFNGTVTWSGASNQFFVTTAMTLNAGTIVTAQNVTMNGGVISGPGTINLNGATTFTGGAFTNALVANVGASGNLNFDSTAGETLDVNTHLTNNGTIQVLSGASPPAINNGAHITNNASAFLQLQGDVTINSDGVASARIDNAGSIQKLAGSGNATLNVAVNNTGNVTSNVGNILYNKSGTHTGGTFTGCAGCANEFVSGTHTLSSTIFSGPAKLIGATWDVLAAGASVNSSFFFGSGTIQGVGNVTISNAFTWSGGTMSGSGQTILSGSSPNVTFDGAFGAMVLTGRKLASSRIINYTPSGSNYLSINSGGNLEINATLNINGDFPINSDQLSGAVLTIKSGAPNLTKTAGTGFSRIYSSVTNLGVVNVSSGQLAFNGGGTNGGTINVPGATNVLAFEDKTYTLTLGTVISGLGTIRVNGTNAVLSVGITTAIDNTELLGGQISAGGTLTFNKKLGWTNGKLFGNFQTATNAIVDHLSPTGVTTIEGDFKNAGTFNYDPGSFNLLITNSTLFTNQASGTFNILGDRFIAAGTGSNGFNNFGMLRKTGGTSGQGTRFDIPLQNLGGTISSEVAGTAIIVNAGGAMNGGTITTTVATATFDIFSGFFNVSGGTFTGTGEINVLGAGQLFINANVNATTTLNLATTSGSLQVTSPNTFQITNFDWKSGNIAASGTVRVFTGHIGNTSATSLNGSGGILTNAGTFNYDGNNTNFLTLNTTTTLNNESGSTFNLLQDGKILGTAGTSVTNMGTFKKTGGTGTSIIGPAVTHSGGSMGATTGTLQFQGGGTFTAPIDTGVAAKVSFAGIATYGINTPATIMGTGTIELIAGATTNVNTAVTIPTLAMFGNLGGTGAVLVNGGQWDGGNMTGSGTTTVNSAATFNFTNTTSRQLARAFINNGTVNEQANGFALEFVSGGSITNNSAFDIQSSAMAFCNAGCSIPAFTNSAAGNLTRNGAGDANWTVAFNNNGSLAVQNGNLQLGAGGTHNGSFTVAAGTILKLNGDTFNASSSVSGAGEVWLQGNGTTNINGSWNIAGNGRTLIYNGGPNNFNCPSPGAKTPILTMDFGAILGGTGDFTITGNATPSSWSAATIQGSGAFIVNSGATLDFNGAFGPGMIDGRVVTNNGTLKLSSPTNALTIESVGSIVNNGLFNLTAGGPINNGFNAGSITNSATGTLQKTLSTGTQTFAPAFTNNGTVDLQIGTLDFTTGFTQNGGTTKLSGGNLSSPFTINLNAGSLTGNGDVLANVANGGTIAPGDPSTAGKIKITGTYTQTGALNIKLGGTTQSTQYDYLELANAAAPTLGGSFTATLFNGFTPANGNTFDVISWQTAPSTTFSSVTLPPIPGGSMSSSYLPTVFQLQAVALSANIAASQTAPPSVNHGANAVITITVSNAGPDTASSVILSGNFTNASFVSATSTVGSCSPGPAATQYSCNIGTLTNGSSAVITLTLNANALATISHSASASTTTSDPVPGNNSTGTANITVNPVADLSIGITDSPDPVAAGQNVTYTVTVSNAGPDSAANVNVALSITNSSIVSATSGTFACSGSGASASCTNAAFGVTSGTITVIATAPAAPGTMSLAGTVSSSTADSNGANNSTSQSTAVTATADLSIAKVASTPAVAGSNVSFTITVTNNGPSDATSVTVNDATPAGTTFVSNSGACTTAYPCALGTLTSGQSVVITSTYAIPPGATGSVANSASVASATTPDPNAGNNTAAASVAITQQADLSINKTGPATLGSGSTIVYTLFVANSGPSNASSVIVNDPTPSGLTFQSNSGACSTPFPCALGTLNAGQSMTITSTFTVNSNSAPITNTASVSSTTPDPVSGNNSDSVTTNVACPTALPVQFNPQDGATGVPTSGTLIWSPVGGQSYSIYLGPAGTGCSMPFASAPSNTFEYAGLTPGTDYEWRIEAINASCPVRTSTCTKFRTASACNSTPPVLIAPANGAVVASPVTFQWSAVANATSYKVFASVGGGATTEIGTTGATSLTATLPSNGPVSWFVVATAPNCGPLQSNIGTFTHCSAPAQVVASVVGEATSGQTYKVEWDAVPGATRYEVDEAGNINFTGATTRSTPATNVPFTHNVDVATAFYYRVRALNDCNATPGPYSLTIRVVIIPLPPKTQRNPNVNVPAGSTQIVVQEVFIPGDPGLTSPFTASVDRPWLAVTPASGLLPPEGITLRVTADPTHLPNGTFTGTVVVVVTPVNVARVSTNASSTKSVPVSISLVTPVTPVATHPEPATNSIIIPSVGHLDGVNSHWQSDIRLSNVSELVRAYQLTFTPGGATGEVKQTTITVDPGATTALDDIVRNWYGIGSLGDGANGVLEIHALDDKNATPSIDLATAVSSRTYNVTTNGTLGQHIPGIPFANFIGKAGSGLAPILSLQQIAQSAEYRTNVGLVEAAGQPASVLLSIFNSAGVKLLDLPIDLAANEQKQLNSLLAQHDISLDDGRLEVRVTGGEGKVTAYASTIDNFTNDPLLVSPVQINSVFASKWVLPGVADLKNSLANWQTDMRVFNAGTGPQSATLTYHPQNNGAPVSVDLVVQSGEVRTLDNVLSTFFGTSNTGGAVHVTTPNDSSLVVTGRTFNQTSTGTFGQFIPAVTLDEAVGAGGRALQILQVEDSTRFRTNLGLAEVSGKPAVAEVQVFLPDSKVSPVIQIPLQANEFRQFGIIRELGLGNIYNARISVRVIDGEGRVTAYGSVIDDETQDPTYVKAQ